jgi:hexosaminidase
MKVTSLTIALLIIAQLGFAQFSIIPAPVEMKAGTGKFTLKSSASVQYTRGNEGLKNVAEMLSAQLKMATGYAIPVVSLGAKAGLGNIILSINQKPVAELGAEGYLLNVTAAQITISANAPAGIFYGVKQ